MYGKSTKKVRIFIRENTAFIRKSTAFVRTYGFVRVGYVYCTYIVRT